MNRRDFRRLHRAGANHAGIILATRSDPAGIAARVHHALGHFEPLDGRCINVRSDIDEEIER
jgi:hypothetical protein